ncbi:Helix-turn-helix domain-containing protein [Nocardia amikacinitolerans]|uniref:helix-turn-helix domain-containing protein n=1 Tax=Nocardia amikacinitolerans TaxID=756689 RepID=UPI00082B0D10|nr:helix-turn-helix transcriptional regulator [Nocardia amikacinitolerans]MCP2320898.1 Helix-turn-helix domain-containing protein [Nocardia amikacinitolerans]
MAPLSPTVARRELMLRIGRRRKQNDVSVSAIAKELGFSISYWSKVEKERVLAESKLDELMKLLDFDAAEREELHELRDIARQRGWWTSYSGLISDEIGRLYGLEHGADSVRTYESILIPGLLQTADYARALIANDRARIRQVEIDRLVEIRLRRQRRLHGSDPLRVTAIVNEAALTQQIGGPEIMFDQVRHLAALLEEHMETIDLRIIPFEATGGGLLGGATFHLLGFDKSVLPDVAWTETLVHHGVIEDTEPVRHLNTLFANALAEQALSREESLAALERKMSGASGR